MDDVCWGRAADRGALAFDCVYTRSADGTLRRRLWIQDEGTGQKETIEGDHRHDDRAGESREDNRLRARVDKLEWVTHSTEHAKGYELLIHSSYFRHTRTYDQCMYYIPLNGTSYSMHRVDDEGHEVCT